MRGLGPQVSLYKPGLHFFFFGRRGCLGQVFFRLGCACADWEGGDRSDAFSFFCCTSAAGARPEMAICFVSGRHAVEQRRDEQRKNEQQRWRQMLGNALLRTRGWNEHFSALASTKGLLKQYQMLSSQRLAAGPISSSKMHLYFLIRTSLSSQTTPSEQQRHQHSSITHHQLSEISFSTLSERYISNPIPTNPNTPYSVTASRSDRSA